jgi:23S rRNA (uracil1939-C5)-methyltransferase
MGRKKELPLLEKIMITDIGAEGNALARVNNQVVFVPMLIPGDIADIQIIRKRKNYMEGRAIRFHKYSADRVNPVCRHFGVCGGCKWQHLPYELQLRYKQKQVADNLSRIGKITLPDISPIAGSQEVLRYRNKLEFSFSDRRWLTTEEINSDQDFEKEDALGFHIPGLYDKVLDIKECHLQPEPSNAIRDSVRRYAHKNSLRFYNPRQQTGFLRNMVIRNSADGKFMVIVVFFHDEPERRDRLLDHLVSEFSCINSLYYVINSKRNDSLSDQTPVLYSGKDHLVEEMDGLKFRIGPKSFFQTNTLQAQRLYSIVLEMAGLKGSEIVYDLYTGIGTIANFIASKAGKVVGIEYIDEAVKDAALNSALNNISNTEFIAGDIREIMSDDFIEKQGSPDIIITDPPRAGMHKDVVHKIIETEPLKIVYISCNPATQARDTALLSSRYRVTRVQPVDMFPQTHHVENIVLLERKKHDQL